MRLLAPDIPPHVADVIRRLPPDVVKLADERVLIRRQAGLAEHVDFEGFGLRVRGDFVHPLLEVLQGLGEQSDRTVVMRTLRSQIRDAALTSVLVLR